MTSRIVIGDIHACFNTLLALINQLPKDVPITFAGDLCDRGPLSKQVVQYIIDNKHDCVLGNHEMMMLDNFKMLEYNKDHTKFTLAHDSLWYMNGGKETLDSYTDEDGVVDQETLDKHLDYFKKLPTVLEYKDCIRESDGRHLCVSHSSVAKFYNKIDEPDFENNEHYKNYIVWNRDTMPKDVKKIYNVFGHTIHDKPVIKDHFACIDTGSFMKNGSITALQFPEMIIYQQKRIDNMVGLYL